MCVFAVLSVFLFTSCTNPLKKHTHTEVDFTEIKDVQLTYKQNLYDVRLKFTRSVLDMEFENNNTAYDGITYMVTPQNCEVNYSGLVHSFEKDVLPPNFMPNLIWQFFVEVGNPFTTENYDTHNECYYLTRTINSFFVRFEAYENQGNVSYTLIIT